MAFFPTSLSGLAAWYDASDSATVTGADPVTQWADKSGNARHLSHATLGPQHDAVQHLMQLRGGAWSWTSAATLDMPAMTVRSVFVFLKAITLIGSAHVCTPVTNAHLVCRPLLDIKILKHK